MAGFNRSEWIAASPEEVFRFAVDPRNAAQVVKDVQNMEQITPGELGQGARLRETRRIDGKDHQTEIEITQYAPPERYSATVEQEGFRVTYHYTFSPENAGTRTQLECVVEAGGLKKLAIPAVVAAMKKEDGDHLERLKQAIETERETGDRG